MKRPFSQFETLARQLVEGSFSRLFGGELEPLEIASRLARAVEDNQQDGRSPDWFQIHLNPADLHSVRQQNPHFSQELATYVARLAGQVGLTLLHRPKVTVEADGSLRRQEVRIYPGYQSPDMPTTQLFQRDELADDIMAAIRAVDAYLIIAGQRHVSLDQPLITLGRRMDNDIVLDSATISRQHAQIRWRYGRFVLYDLSRRSRTLVNSQPVTEYALQPGDVIALSTVLLIYGEGGEERQVVNRPDGDTEKTLVKSVSRDP